MPLPADESADMIAACAHLVERCGGSGFDFGYIHEDVPSEQAGWWATAYFRGARITATDQPSPTAAFMALAIKLLHGSLCRCGKPVVINADQPGCRWRLMGDRWTSSCDAPALSYRGVPGDIGAIHAAAEARFGNRQTRRRATRNKKKRRR